MRDTKTEYGTLKRYATGNIQKVDLIVIDRWCDYLNCTFEDIIEYKKA
ncbi:MAG: helix-turn-helix transcriptional regulator [Defluviitaleaceae bacterium]|nr:helix-turn-helix transcriptional regulator [Defluviitaleaceae bacterium]